MLLAVSTGHPPPTPPAYVEELARSVERHEVGLAQAKRDAAYLFSAHDLNGQRFERVLQRIDFVEMGLHEAKAEIHRASEALEHRLANIEKLLGVLAEQGRARA